MDEKLIYPRTCSFFKCKKHGKCNQTKYPWRQEYDGSFNITNVLTTKGERIKDEIRGRTGRSGNSGGYPKRKSS